MSFGGAFQHRPFYESVICSIIEYFLRLVLAMAVEVVELELPLPM